jgi:hypothetical protein
VYKVPRDLIMYCGYCFSSYLQLILQKDLDIMVVGGSSNSRQMHWQPLARRSKPGPRTKICPSMVYQVNFNVCQDATSELISLAQPENGRVLKRKLSMILLCHVMALYLMETIYTT